MPINKCSRCEGALGRYKSYCDSCHKAYCKDCKNVVVTILDRLDSSRGYTLDNVVSCCSSRNSAKWDLSLEDFIMMCNKIAQNHPRSI